jgi:CRISPR-associated protein Csm5
MNYELNILSPVHIGTGKQLTPFEFAITEGKFVVMDMDTIIEANPQRADDLNSSVESDPIHFSLSDFLTTDEKTNPAFWKYSAALDATTEHVLQEELRKAKDMNVDVDEYIKTSVDHQVYIPGSSLKGAFRTALAYATFRADEYLFNELKKRLEMVDWRRSDEAVDELIFLGARRDPKYDLFKTLRFSESSTLPADEQTLEIGKMKILSITSPRKKLTPRQGTMYKQLEQFRSAMTVPSRSPMKQWWTIQEVLKPGTVFTGTVSIDDRLLHNANAKRVLQWKVPHQTNFSLEQLIRAANTFSLDICDWELNFFEHQVQDIDVVPILDFYRDLKQRITNAEKSACFLCLGQGAGWHKMTVGMLLERDKTFNFRGLRRELRLADRRLNLEYPKSRKLLMKSDDEFQGVLGWIEVRFG